MMRKNATTIHIHTQNKGLEARVDESRISVDYFAMTGLVAGK
jgi:hypothetical protein